MAAVVYATINNISALPNAIWRAGDSESYANTKGMAEAQQDRSGSIALIGRQADSGRVSLAFARSPGGAWSAVNEWHLELARFFSAQLDQHPEAFDTDLSPFIADPAPSCARQLVRIDCGEGAAADSEQFSIAVTRVNNALRALGVPAADWTYEPIAAAAA